MTVPPPGAGPCDGNRPKPWLPPAADACPVDAAAQRWTEGSIRWLMREFGEAVIHRKPVLPTADFLSTQGWNASAEDIEALVARLAELMRVDQLCHLRLRGEGRLTGQHRDEERLTDLATVFFGFGIFTTNAAMRFARNRHGYTLVSRGELDDHDLNAADHNEGYRSLGYLSSREFGYALACYCWVRAETEPPAWTRHVDPGPRVHLEQGLAYLRRTTRPPGRPTAAG